jgi:hypothetical protein
MLFPIIGTVLMGVGFGPRNIKLLRVLLGGLIVSCLMLLASCGGSGGGEGGGAGTPAGTYTITVLGVGRLHGAESYGYADSPVGGSKWSSYAIRGNIGFSHRS